MTRFRILAAIFGMASLVGCGGEIAPGFGYGLGIARLSLPSAVVYGHDGVFGIWAVYVPAAGASIIVTLNQAAADPWDLLQELVAAAVDAGG